MFAGPRFRRALEDYLGPVFEKYWEAATGRPFPGSGHNPEDIKFDAATNRHYIERFVAAAAKTITVNKDNSVESFFEKVDAEYERDKASGELEDLRNEEQDDEQDLSKKKKGTIH